MVLYGQTLINFISQKIDIYGEFIHLSPEKLYFSFLTKGKQIKHHPLSQHNFKFHYLV
jgi:hypothetical protein